MVQVTPKENANTTAKEGAKLDLQKTVEKPLWEQDDAPRGSTAESLLHYENGRAVAVSGPTHYHQLANGQFIGGYGIGTHHADGDSILPIVNIYSGE